MPHAAAGASRPRPVRSPLFVVLGLAAGCRVADAKISNLNEVHHPDGRTKYVGRVHGDIEYVLRTMLSSSHFAGGSPSDAEKKIDDPLGVCLENLIELGACDQDDPRVLAATVEVVSWLAKDCEYALSREQCAEELVPLGRRLGLTGPLELPPGAPVAGVDEVASAVMDLTRVTIGALAGDASRALELGPTCDRVRALNADREGARRLLGATNLLCARVDEPTPGFDALRALRRELAQRCAGLALTAVLTDPVPRVRAAGLHAAVSLAPESSAARIDAGLADPDPDVRTAAVREIALHDLGRRSPEERERWIGRLVDLLRTTFDGELSIALCKTLAHLTGRPRDLRPEAWIKWWEESGGAAPAP